MGAVLRAGRKTGDGGGPIGAWVATVRFMAGRSS
jgi:hypothetical protein